MLKVCENITAQAETLYKQSNSKNSVVEVEPESINDETLKNHEKRHDEFDEIVKEILDLHLKNQGLWSDFLVQFQSAQNLTDGTREQLQNALSLFEELTKMLDQLDTYLSNFRVLGQITSKEDVIADYRDLEYDNKLEFLEEDEQALKDVR